jgi:Mrp family chromosome partitioning ATPase
MADVVIVDGPPILVSDAILLSTEVDEVLMVVGCGLTRKSESIVAIKQLRSVGAKVSGVVLNRIPRKNRNYFRLYHYDYGMTDETGRALKLGKLSIPLGSKRATSSKSSSKAGKKQAADEQAGPVAD